MHDDLSTSCVELPVVLIPHPVLEDIVTDLHIPCGQTIMIPTHLSAPIAEINSYVDISAPSEIIAAANAPRDLPITSDLDHIKLVRHDDAEAINSFQPSLWSIMLDPPMSLSHAMNRIAEIT